jgi:hypothetical protein
VRTLPVPPPFLGTTPQATAALHEKVVTKGTDREVLPVEREDRVDAFPVVSQVKQWRSRRRPATASYETDQPRFFGRFKRGVLAAQSPKIILQRFANKADSVCLLIQKR